MIRLPFFVRPMAAALRHNLCQGPVLITLLALGLGGCAASHDVTGSIASSSALPSANGDLQGSAADLGRRYESDPANRANAVSYARVLRALNRNAQAVAVLENIAIKNPYDREVLAAYGKALADIGRAREAGAVLERAHTPDQPDWSILSAQGSVADQLGDHAAAQDYYTAALKIRPNSPHVLSNLGLSYALSKQLPLAEQTLRNAAAAPGADMRVRQNLSLVLALQGKFKEAEAVAQTDLSPADAAASVAAIQTMIAQSSTWRAVQKPARRPSPVDRTAPG